MLFYMDNRGKHRLIHAVLKQFFYYNFYYINIYYINKLFTIVYHSYMMTRHIV